MKMTKDEILEVVLRDVAKIAGVPISQLNGNTDLIRLGIDSLRLLELIASLEMRFNLSLEPEHLIVGPRIGAIVNMIEMQIAHSS